MLYVEWANWNWDGELSSPHSVEIWTLSPGNHLQKVGLEVGEQHGRYVNDCQVRYGNTGALSTLRAKPSKGSTLMMTWEWIS